MNGAFLRAARAAFAWCLPDEIDREAIYGDLEEEHAERRSRHGQRHADRWLLGQLRLSAAPLLRQRLVSESSLRSASAVGLAWLCAAAVFVTFTAASVMLFSVWSLFAGMRLFVYLGVAFSAAMTAGLVVRRRQKNAGARSAVTLALLLAASIGAIFLHSPEHETLEVWIVWTTVVTCGVFLGTRVATRRERGPLPCD